VHSRLNAGTLISQASERSGLKIRGEETFRPGLEHFLEDFARSDCVTPKGHLAVEQLILTTLEARYRMGDWIHIHPEVLETPVVQPVFILGLPRAGTTMLVNLLALDPQRRVYWSWEALREIPPVEQSHLYDDPRIARKVAEVNAALACGLLDHRHHVEMGDEPAECTFLLGQDFKSNLWLSQTPVPRYFEWLYEKADMRAAYRYQQRALKVLQSRAPGKWTLKLPSHAPFIGPLLDVFPDARIVVTHRDPIKPLPSSCAADMHFIGLISKGADAVYIGDETMKVFEASIDRVEAARVARTDVPFHDCHYRRFVIDPIAEIRRLYDFLGDELTPDVEARMTRAVRAYETRRKEAGANVYRLEDYGLSRDRIEARFADYISRHGIERE